MNPKIGLIAALVLMLTMPLAIGGAAGADDMGTTFSGATTDGGDFTLDPYLGKVPIILDFGSIYCSSCIKSIPALVVLQKEYGESIKVVGVNLDTYGLERVKRFYAAFKGNLNFPILIDKGLKISKAYNVQTLPTYIILDKTGKIVSTIVGYDQESKEKMEEIIAGLVKGVEPSPAAKVVAPNVLILSPDNFTKTVQEDIGVIGTTGGTPGPITVRLNGASESEAVIKGGMFYARMNLALGSNFIEVRYPKGEGFGTSAVVLFRDPRMGEGLGVNFPEFQFHLPDREARCTSCHTMEPDLSGGLVSASGICASCHKNLVQVKYVHGPIPVGGCAACHEFDTKPHRYDVEAQGTDLCFTCHTDIQDKFAKASIHGPVAMGLCVACHSPHGSGFRFQLRNQQGSLCLGCHEEARPMMSNFKPHKPVRDDDCTGCHDPHASDSPKYFLRGEGAELCYLCHSREMMNAHTHQKQGPPTRVVQGMKLDKEGNINCQSCHNPHSSDEDRLFTVKGGCKGCHNQL